MFLKDGSSFQLVVDTGLPGCEPLCFPCDHDGNVAIETLQEEARRSYLFARVVCRRQRIAPAVLPAGSRAEPRNPSSDDDESLTFN